MSSTVFRCVEPPVVPTPCERANSKAASVVPNNLTSDEGSSCGAEIVSGIVPAKTLPVAPELPDWKIAV